MNIQNIALKFIHPKVMHKRQDVQNPSKLLREKNLWAGWPSLSLGTWQTQYPLPAGWAIQLGRVLSCHYEKTPRATRWRAAERTWGSILCGTLSPAQWFHPAHWRLLGCCCRMVNSEGARKVWSVRARISCCHCSWCWKYLQCWCSCCSWW